MSNNHTSQASVSVDVAATVAHLRKILALLPQAGIPPTIVSRCPKPRKPKTGNIIAPPAHHPHVLACNQVRLWSMPHSTTFHSSLLRQLPLDDIVQLLDAMLVSVEIKTHENYRSDLLWFHQYCDSQKIHEKLHMPTSDHLLALSIASWAGKVAGTTVQNWPVGLHFWHNLHGTPWNGHSLVCSAMAGLTKLVPSTSKRPHHLPVTLECMHLLLHHLDLSNVFDVSVFAIASTAFWSCCRYAVLP